MKLQRKASRKKNLVIDLKFRRKCRELEVKYPDLARDKVAIKKMIERDKAKMLKILEIDDEYHRAAIKSLLNRINFLARYIGDIEYELVEENKNQSKKKL